MLEKLNIKDFDKVYEIMEQSFPKDEYRPYEGQKALLEEEPYQIYVFRDGADEDIKGFITVWEYEELVFVEHLAVSPRYRNGGLGSVILKETADIRRGKS